MSNNNLIQLIKNNIDKNLGEGNYQTFDFQQAQNEIIKINNLINQQTDELVKHILQIRKTFLEKVKPLPYSKIIMIPLDLEAVKTELKIEFEKPYLKMWTMNQKKAYFLKTAYFGQKSYNLLKNKHSNLNLIETNFISFSLDKAQEKECIEDMKNWIIYKQHKEKMGIWYYILDFENNTEELDRMSLLSWQSLNEKEKEKFINDRKK